MIRSCAVAVGKGIHWNSGKARTTIGEVQRAPRPRGAVWHDIQNVLRRRLSGFHLILAPATVQGDAAPAEIIRALRKTQN